MEVLKLPIRTCLLRLRFKHFFIFFIKSASEDKSGIIEASMDEWFRYLSIEILIVNPRESNLELSIWLKTSDFVDVCHER